MKKLICVFLPLATMLAGCGATNSYLADRTSTVEMYHIFDIKTTASTAAMAQAAVDGLSRNTNSVDSKMPLQIGATVPEQPGRFSLVDMGTKLAGTGLGNMLQIASLQGGGSVSMRSAVCDSAVWTAKAVRQVTNSNTLTLYACLYKYTQGYHLDTYAVFRKIEGGIAQVSRDIAFKLVGTPEEWVNKTIWDMVRAMEAAGNAKMTRLEGQPELGSEPAIAQAAVLK